MPYSGWLLFAGLLAASLPSAARAFDGIRVTLLGTGGEAASSERFGPATLVEAGDEVFLFDCGSGVAQRLAQAGVPAGEIDVVFLTHLHSEHTAGFHDLWLTDSLQARQGPMLVIGPEGTGDLMRSLQLALRAGIESRPGARPTGAGIDARDVSENLVYQTAEVTVTALVVDHGPMPAYGYRVDYRGRRSLVLSGDTRYSENLIRNARGVQLLVHEVAAADPELAQSSRHIRQLVSVHSSPEDAARVFQRAHPYLAVYSPVMAFDVTGEQIMRRTRSIYKGAVELGHDLMIIEIQDEVQIRAVPSEVRPRRD
jgi:ribonuclease Z